MESQHWGGLALVWRAALGWQVEFKVYFGPNLVSFLLTLGARRWYILGAYVLLNDIPAINCVEEALIAAPKELEIILMGDLNVRLRYPCDKREKDLETVLADRGLVSITDHFMPRRRYRGAGIWSWSMQQEVRQVTGKGSYFLSMDRCNFTNVGLR